MQVIINGSPSSADAPNICPHCHVTIVPKFHWNAPTEDSDGEQAYLSIWGCTNINCKKLFVAMYKLVDSEYLFDRFLGGLPKGPIWPQPILDLTDGKDDLLKSKFIRTYLQSLEAENLGLDEIAGMGYRKAIEYLVKDWAIKNNPTEKEKITNSWLSVVINDFYEGDLKDILERATWLGNDQSHYNKLFEEYKISDLKELIDLIMVELDRQYKKNHYIETIQKKNS